MCLHPFKCVLLSDDPSSWLVGIEISHIFPASAYMPFLAVNLTQSMVPTIIIIFGSSRIVIVRGTYMYINISLWCDRWSDHWSVLRRLSRIRDKVPPKTLPGYSSFVSSSSSVSSPLLSSLLATAAWTAGISSYFDRRLVLWPEIWFSLKPYENILHFLTQSIIIIIVLAVIITWWWSP